MVVVGGVLGAFNILNKSSVSLRLSVLSKVSLIWVWEVKMRVKMVVEIAAEESSQKEETEEGNKEAEWPGGHGRISGCPSAELLQTAADLDCRLGATDSVSWCSPGLGWARLGSWASSLSEVSDVQWQRKVSSTPPVFSSSTPAATATAQICHFLSSGSCGGTRPRLYRW